MKQLTKDNLEQMLDFALQAFKQASVAARVAQDPVIGAQITNVALNAANTAVTINAELHKNNRAPE